MPLEFKQVESLAEWVPFLHRLTRNGKASKISFQNEAQSMVMFNMADIPAKWSSLAEAETIWIFYKKRSQHDLLDVRGMRLEKQTEQLPVL